VSVFWVRFIPPNYKPKNCEVNKKARNSALFVFATSE